MPLNPAILTLAVFGLAATAALGGAALAARTVEDRSARAVEIALESAGLAFAEVETDGLQLLLIGNAPTEALRFRAISVAGMEVDAARVIDMLHVEAAQDIAPPRFSIEVLRNAAGVSLIGLVPADTDREALVERIGDAASAPVADLLQTAQHPVPRGWAQSLDYAIWAMTELPRSQISITANSVAITAASTSVADKARLEDRLQDRKPGSLRLSLALSAPRPVLSPFTLRFRIEDGLARFDACSADTEAAAERILAAALEAGARAESCTLGLGVPSPTWGAATARGIRALAELGGGTVTFADGAVTLTGDPAIEQARFDEVVGAFERDLPTAFALSAVLPRTDSAAEDAPEFTATRGPEGGVRLTGRLPDERTRTAVASLARARFGSDAVDVSARTVDGLPRDWSLRVMGGLEALARLDDGTLRVREGALDLSGRTGSRETSAEVAALLTGALGEGAPFSLDITYDEALDPLAALPTPDECITQIGAVTAARKITFAPGSADLEAEGRQALAQIAEILEGCPPMSIDISAHSDSQGREEMNLSLSQDRADAVMADLLRRRVVDQTLTATGFGEANPIADNDTPEGREANRRIEFALAAEAEARDASAGADVESAADEDQDEEGE